MTVILRGQKSYVGTDAERAGVVPTEIGADYWSTNTDIFYIWNGVIWVASGGGGAQGVTGLQGATVVLKV